MNDLSIKLDHREHCKYFISVAPITKISYIHQYKKYGYLLKYGEKHFGQLLLEEIRL